MTLHELCAYEGQSYNFLRDNRTWQRSLVYIHGFKAQHIHQLSCTPTVHDYLSLVLIS